MSYNQNSRSGHAYTTTHPLFRRKHCWLEYSQWQIQRWGLGNLATVSFGLAIDFVPPPTKKLAWDTGKHISWMSGSVTEYSQTVSFHFVLTTFRENHIRPTGLDAFKRSYINIPTNTHTHTYIYNTHWLITQLKFLQFGKESLKATSKTNGLGDGFVKKDTST